MLWDWMSVPCKVALWAESRYDTAHAMLDGAGSWYFSSSRSADLALLAVKLRTYFYAELHVCSGHPETSFLYPEEDVSEFTVKQDRRRRGACRLPLMTQETELCRKMKSSMGIALSVFLGYALGS